MNHPSLSSLPLWAIAAGYSNAVSDESPRPRNPRQRKRAMGYAVVELQGVLRKPEFVAAREQVNLLAANPHVGEILVLVDSPGGTVAGVHDLYSAIAAAAKQKRVTAVIEDLAASAAYYAIAGATEIVINPTGNTGSIGVYAVFADASELFRKLGIEIIVIRSGAHKGTGVEGTNISQQQIDQLQAVVDAQGRHFITAVARGRRMSVDRAKELADGRVLVGEQAVAAGLVDKVRTFEDVIADAETRQRDLAVQLQYAELSPHQCQVKYEELVDEEIHENGLSERAATAIVKSRHPQLAKIALKLIREEEKRHESSGAWSQSHGF